MHRLIYLYISIIAFIIALILLIVLASPMQGAEDGRLPKPRPDQIPCQSIQDGIQGMAAITNTAGVTYFADHGAISSTLSLTRTFRLSLWDADGSGGTVVRIGESTISYSTTNNVWSNWVEVHKPFTPTIQVILPHDHPSTSLCFDLGFQGYTEPTQTPVETAIQPTLTNTPIPTATPYRSNPVQTPSPTVIVPAPAIMEVPVPASEAWAPTNAEDQDEPVALLFQLIVDINRDRLGGSDEPLYHGECGVQNSSKGYAKVIDVVDGYLSLVDLIKGDTYQIDCYRLSYRFVPGEINGAAAIPVIVPGDRVWIAGVIR
jgi:hypothetical protein